MPKQDRNLYLSWLTMTQREREELYVKAFDDTESRSLFNKMYTSIRMETNKRLKELERKHYDYGKAYDNLVRYLQIEQDHNRVPFQSEIKYNIDDMMTIMTQSRKFLKSKRSKWEFREAETTRRIQHFDSHEEYGKMWKGWSKKRKREFLRWLGSEQASFSMDEYGTSDSTIIILADAFNESKKTTNGLKTLNKALDEFNGGMITFNDAMKQVGVNIAKDLKRSWHNEKRSISTYLR